MRKIFLSFIFILTCGNAYAGLADVSRPFCEKIQKLGPILNAFTVIQWPVTGVPGITMGMAQNTSALLDLCNLVMQIEQLSTEDAIFATAGALNEMTDNRWKSHLDQADRTWNLANTIYDFENGKSRKGAFESVSTYHQINNFIDKSYTYYHKTFNGKEARLKNRYERQRDMEVYARLAWKRAILAEATNCPKPQDNTNYSDLYQKEVAPAQAEKQEAELDVDFFKGQLLKMAPNFMNNQSELTKFSNELENLMTGGVNYQVRYSTESDKTTKSEGKDENGVEQVKTETIKRKVQKFSVRTYQDVFQAFKDRWDGQWRSWVTAQFLGRGGIRGLIIGKKKRILDQFINMSYECNPDQVTRGMDTSRPDYWRERKKRIKTCRENLYYSMTEAKGKSLFQNYVDRLKLSLQRLKKANAKIWSAESKYLGINRTIDIADASDNFQQEQVKCKENLKPAEMQKLSLKQQQVENEYNEMISKQLLKQTTMKEEEMKANQKLEQEFQRRRSFAEEQQIRQKEEVMDATAPFTTKGGI